MLWVRPRVEGPLKLLVSLSHICNRLLCYQVYTWGLIIHIGGCIQGGGQVLVMSGFGHLTVL